MAEFPTYEKIAKDVAEKALDGFLYQGKTIREWMKIITERENKCTDLISRQAVKEKLDKMNPYSGEWFCESDLDEIPSVIFPETVTEFADRCRECGKLRRCKDCKFFEYDSVANIDGIPLIVAHEICKKWGDGCKTKENGYCFLFEPKEDPDGCMGEDSIGGHEET